MEREREKVERERGKVERERGKVERERGGVGVREVTEKYGGIMDVHG